MTDSFFHNQVWKRFMRLPYGHIVDYTDGEGTVFFPTAEDCKRSVPNAFGRWTPIINGAMFSGLYLSALIRKYTHEPDPQTADEIRLGLLWLAEKDTQNREYYLHACRMNGVAALPFLKRMSDYDNVAEDFSVDWRPLATIWEPFDGTFDTAIDLSNKTSKYWRVNMVPYRKMEHSVLGEALFAAWIAASCPEERIVVSAIEQLRAYSAHVDWDTVHLPYAFVAEGALLFGKTNGCNL